MRSVWTTPIQDVTFGDIEDFVGLSIRENEMVEYKSDRPKQPLGIWLCAFANLHGGILLIGVHTKNERPTVICGYDKTKLVERHLDLEACKCVPPLLGHFESKVIDLPSDPSRAVMIVRVRRDAPDVPYSYEGYCYIRTNESKRRAEDFGSKHNDMATIRDLLYFLRSRDRADAIRRTLQDDVDHRLPPPPRNDIRLLPDIVSDPKGGLTWERFQDVILKKAPIYSQKGFFPVSPEEPGPVLRLQNGLGLNRQAGQGKVYFEVQRNGGIWRSEWGEGRRGFPSHNNGLFLDSIFMDLLKTLTYAAQVYRYVEYFGNVRVFAKYHGVKGRSACIERQADRAQDAIVVENLENELVVPSSQLIENPLEVLELLITDLQWPTGVPPSDLLDSLKSSFDAQAEGRILFEKGSWTKDWQQFSIG